MNETVIILLINLNKILIIYFSQQGNVANHVETEQILIQLKPNYQKLPICSSFI